MASPTLLLISQPPICDEGHNLRGIIGPDLRGFGGWGEIGAVFCVRQNGPDCIVATRFNGINFSLTN
jgi:hypothetical protein